jgi:hypothetical protein
MQHVKVSQAKSTIIISNAMPYRIRAACLPNPFPAFA